jgi:hypothetical protein
MIAPNTTIEQTIVSQIITTNTVPSGPNSPSVLVTRVGMIRGESQTRAMSWPPVSTALGSSARQPTLPPSSRWGVHHQNSTAPVNPVMNRIGDPPGKPRIAVSPSPESTKLSAHAASQATARQDDRTTPSRGSCQIRW